MYRSARIFVQTSISILDIFITHIILASCQWGPATPHVIYMVMETSHLGLFLDHKNFMIGRNKEIYVDEGITITSRWPLVTAGTNSADRV